MSQPKELLDHPRDGLADLQQAMQAAKLIAGQYLQGLKISNSQVVLTKFKGENYNGQKIYTRSAY